MSYSLSAIATKIYPTYPVAFMAAAPTYLSLITTLQKAVGLLAPAQTELKTAVVRQCDRISQPNLRITVFGPFNYGKSTLLNALLGEKTLPIDLVPTTGAVITLTYGPALMSRITFADGTSLEESGTDLLQRYATLNDQRQMPHSVTAVEVQCPHSLLQSGIELVDLPGTDDQERQNELVYASLLKTDIVIQVLDGRKLMTLDERTQLQEWLLDQGITTVLFVVNFLNLMEPEERTQVMERLQMVAQDFCTSLPAGVSNLYGVDALPALRARLKGDLAAASNTGLSTFDSALHTLARTWLPDLPRHRVCQLLPLVSQVQQALQQQLASIDTASRRRAIQQRVQQLIQTGFQQSVTDLQTWLELNNLLKNYQTSLARAIQTDTAALWLAETLQPGWKQKKRAVTEWVYKACDFFEQPRPVDLWIHWQLPNSQARDYLVDFSKTALAALDTYQTTASPILYRSVAVTKTGQQTLLENTLAELEQLQAELTF